MKNPRKGVAKRTGRARMTKLDEQLTDQGRASRARTSPARNESGTAARATSVSENIVLPDVRAPGTDQPPPGG